MKTRQLFLRTILTITLLALLTIPALALGSTHYVAPGGICGGHTPCYASIQAAVDAASSGDTVLVAEGTYTGVTTRGELTQLVYLDKSLTIRGGYTTAYSEPPDPAAHPTILDAQTQGRVIYIPDIAAANITLEGLRLTHGVGYVALLSDNEGGGLRMLGSTDDRLTLRNNWIGDNFGWEEGSGGIGVARAQLLLIGNTITANAGVGVKVEWSSPSVILTGNTISNNGTGTYVNMGIRLEADAVELTGNTFSGNGTDGAFIDMAKTVSVVDNTFRQNLKNGLTITMGEAAGIIRANTFDANGRGANLSGNLQISDNTFMNNYDPSVSGQIAKGAGLVAGYGHLEVFDNVFTGNQSADGGAIAALCTSTECSVVIHNNDFTVNQSGDGGAIYVANQGVTIVENNIILDNQAQYGGGVAVDQEANATIRGNLFLNNTATTGGGAVYCRACTFTLERNWFTGNMGGTYGNVLHIQWLNWAIYGIPQTESVIVNNIIYDEETDSTPTVTIHSSQVVMTHNTLIRNPQAVIGVGVWVENTLTDLPAKLTMTNNIVGGHAEGVRLVSGSASTEGTLWGTGDWDNTTDWTGAVNTGTVNLWGDPLFVNPAASDYHISSNSPARDAGVAVSIEIDIDRESRPHTDTDLYDIGADEYHLDDLKLYLPLVVR